MHFTGTVYRNPYWPTWPLLEITQGCTHNRCKFCTMYKDVPFVGPTELLVSGDTLQLKDYSKTDWPWTLFNPEEKQHRHETIFPQECRKAYEMGAALAR